ncbi:MAG: alpha/beta hydrolase [Clostridia bacterium]|nr:alpha/beta hydrolase [Clostridia bacterium]
MSKSKKALLFSVMTIVILLFSVYNAVAQTTDTKGIKPEISVENYTVYVTNADTVTYIRFALGDYTTSLGIKNAADCVTLNSTVIKGNTFGGVLSYEMPNGGIYSFWVKTSAGNEYIYSSVDITKMTPEVSVNGVTVTAKNFYAIKDLFIAKGHWSSYPEIKTNGYVVCITSNKLAYVKSYSYTLKDEGDYTVFMRFKDGTTWYRHINIDCINPTFKPNGLQLTVGNLQGVKVVRTAYGEYTTISALKKAASQRAFTSKGVLKDKEEYTLQYRQNGMVTVVVQYENGYYEFYYHNIEKKLPTFRQEENKVIFGDLDGLNLIRYAKGNYTSASQIKNAEDSRYLKADSIENGTITVTLSPGTYTFCVQYGDESQSFYVVSVSGVFTKNYSFTNSSGKTVSLPFWLYTPDNATDDMPLIVVLHSAHVKYKNELTAEENLINLVTYEKDDFPKYFYNGEFGNIPAYMVIPQTPSSSLGWPSRGAEIVELIKYCEREYKTDANRVSVIGYSLGGTGAVELAAAYPDVFSKAVSVAGGLDGITNNIRPYIQGYGRIQLSESYYPELRVLNSDSTAYEKNYMKYLYEANANKLKYLAQSDGEIAAANKFKTERIKELSDIFNKSSVDLWTIVGSKDAEVEYSVHDLLCTSVTNGNAKSTVLEGYSHSKALTYCLDQKSEIIDFLING